MSILDHQEMDFGVQAIRDELAEYNGIMFSYPHRNYSGAFINRVKDKVKIIFVSSDNMKGTIATFCKATGNEFMIEVDLDKKQIKHKGCYSENRCVSSLEIIDHNLTYFKIHLL